MTWNTRANFILSMKMLRKKKNQASSSYFQTSKFENIYSLKWDFFERVYSTHTMAWKREKGILLSMTLKQCFSN